ncbi:MAG: peptidase C1 [Bacteroidota bacterium]|nr:peptidase C1 [Bacteroidota bacterium]
MKKLVSLLSISIFLSLTVFGQNKDKAIFKEYEAGYYQNFILKDVRNVEKINTTKEKDKRFFMDQSELILPNDLSDYVNTLWHKPTISQGSTGTCWCFSTISFFESEIYRMYEKKVKLSEIYVVYWEYVEKAKGFVATRGKSYFSQGSEGNAVTRMIKMYGIVPWDVYNGLPNERKFHSHDAMYREMRNYLKSVKEDNAWNEKCVIATIKSIMNHHIGEPPTEFEYDGKTITPKEYMKNVLKFHPDDYVEILSYKQEPYWKKVEYKVPDNWWHSKEYYNVPLDDFMNIVKSLVEDGYTVSIGGDVSEAGFLRTTNCALIPTFDIPSEYIDENARQFRFSNKTTTDDHGMHLVGSTKFKDDYWFLIKDSSSGSRNIGEDKAEFGYYFFHEDYIKLKMMGFTVHKDAVKKVLKNF